nr:hypothetical protein [Tanacetum cinerariifolium]
MLRKGSDFSEESVEKSWGKNQLMKAVRSLSHDSIVPLMSSSSHIFASLVSDKHHQADNFILGISVFKHITDSEEFMNVFMRIDFGFTIKLVSFEKGQVVTFNGKFVCGFRNSDCGTRSQSDNTVGSPHRFIIHWIVILKNIKKVTEVIDVENWRIDNSWVFRWVVSLNVWNSSVSSTKSSIQRYGVYAWRMVEKCLGLHKGDSCVYWLKNV